jgi:hypothetical protein
MMNKQTKFQVGDIVTYSGGEIPNRLDRIVGIVIEVNPTHYEGHDMNGKPLLVIGTTSEGVWAVSPEYTTRLAGSKKDWAGKYLGEDVINYTWKCIGRKNQMRWVANYNLNSNTITVRLIQGDGRTNNFKVHHHATFTMDGFTSPYMFAVETIIAWWAKELD